MRVRKRSKTIASTSPSLAAVCTSVGQSPSAITRTPVDQDRNAGHAVHDGGRPTLQILAETASSGRSGISSVPDTRPSRSSRPGPLRGWGVRRAVVADPPGPVTRVEVQRGGFSRAFAGILPSASGEEVYVQAASPELYPDLPEVYRREWGIASPLPADVPTPRRVWSEDDGRWVTLAFEAIRGGNPRLPWGELDLDRVGRTAEAMRASLTPAPIPARSLQEKHTRIFRRFRTLSLKVMTCRTTPVARSALGSGEMSSRSPSSKGGGRSLPPAPRSSIAACARTTLFWGRTGHSSWIGQGRASGRPE